jgi:predicted ATPase
MMDATTAPNPGRGGFIGRERELAVFRRAREAAPGEQRRVLIISGEPGVGKTRLLTEAAAEATAAGWRVLLGHAYDSEGMPAYLPFLEALRDHVRTCDIELLRSQLGPGAAEVALLMPELRQRLPDLPSAAVDASGDRYRLFEAMGDFLAGIAAAAQSGLLICLDDLHWADEPSLLLLEHVVRRPPTVPMLFIVTYRDTDLDVTRPLSRTLEELTRLRSVQRVDLERLPKAEVARMLSMLARPNPPAPLVDAIYRESEGNPFFVQELVEYLAEDGRLFDAAGAWRDDLELGETEVPQGVRLTVGRRLERLSESCRRTLATAAALGRAIDYDILQAMTEVEDDALMEALDEAHRAQVLTAGASGRLTFAHELIRQTLLTSLSPLRLQRLHLRTVDALEQSRPRDVEANIGEMAGHLRLAGAAADPEKAFAYTLRAAAAAERVFAWEEAILCYRWCLDALGDGVEPPGGRSGAAGLPGTHANVRRPARRVDRGPNQGGFVLPGARRLGRQRARHSPSPARPDAGNDRPGPAQPGAGCTRRTRSQDRSDAADPASRRFRTGHRGGEAGCRAGGEPGGRRAVPGVRGRARDAPWACPGSGGPPGRGGALLPGSRASLSRPR